MGVVVVIKSYLVPIHLLAEAAEQAAADAHKKQVLPNTPTGNSCCPNRMHTA